MKKDRNSVSGYKTGISEFILHEVHRNSGWVEANQLIFKLYVL